MRCNTYFHSQGDRNHTIAQGKFVQDRILLASKEALNYRAMTRLSLSNVGLMISDCSFVDKNSWISLISASSSPTGKLSCKQVMFTGHKSFSPPRVYHYWTSKRAGTSMYTKGINMVHANSILKWVWNHICSCVQITINYVQLKGEKLGKFSPLQTSGQHIILFTPHAVSHQSQNTSDCKLLVTILKATKL